MNECVSVCNFSYLYLHVYVNVYINVYIDLCLYMYISYISMYVFAFVFSRMYGLFLDTLCADQTRHLTVGVWVHATAWQAWIAPDMGLSPLQESN